MDKKKKILIITMILIIIAIIGGTFAWLTWTSSTNTLVSFTVTPTFSCSVDGGGDITNEDAFIIPTDECTNTENAIVRKITTNVINTGLYDVSMDLWLDVEEMGTGLSDSENFSYALTTSPTSCVTDKITSGTFNGKTKGTKVNLLDGVTYSGNETGEYYLYIWLDSAETSSSTMNQTFQLSLNGSCEDKVPVVGTYDDEFPIEWNSSAVVEAGNPTLIATLDGEEQEFIKISNLTPSVNEMQSMRISVVVSENIVDCAYYRSLEADIGTVYGYTEMVYGVVMGLVVVTDNSIGETGLYAMNMPNDSVDITFDVDDEYRTVFTITSDSVTDDSVVYTDDLDGTTLVWLKVSDNIMTVDQINASALFGPGESFDTIGEYIAEKNNQYIKVEDKTGAVVFVAFFSFIVSVYDTSLNEFPETGTYVLVPDAAVVYKLDFS